MRIDPDHLILSATQADGPSSIPLWQLVAAGFGAWVSFVLVGWIWIKHSGLPVIKKIFWTMVVMVPPLGWMFFWGFSRPPSRTGYETPDSIQFGSGGLD